MKIRVNKIIENQKTIEKNNKTENWFFEKINKIDKSLAILAKKKSEKAQVPKIRNKRGYITTEFTKEKGL